MSTVQPGAAPRLGYLGTTASSRAKVSQDPPSPSLSSEPLPGPDRPEDQSSDAPSSQKYQPLMASPQALGTPTEEPSQGGASRWSVGSSSEETPTNQSQTLIIVSPAPSVTPTKRDIIKSDITSCSVSRQEDDRGENESVSLQQCQQVANELRQTARRAARLHRKAVLQGEGRGLQDEGTMSLLEKYSELLVQMTQNKLNRI
ncbi:putative WD repeat-containing protein 62-like [Scophthalmus maximus]|uniref:Putative WD repeat-containing protein 62-like n=1 Tax=Scophthalmus maximus TaxID=52904 RepID=A0A2U9B6D6_SCOMX|nr:putative WD repeat-containing protein 62-like [Scophthalmus maximus]